MKRINMKNRFIALLLFSSAIVIFLVAALSSIQIFRISEDVSIKYAGMYAAEIVHSVNENLSVDVALIESFSKRQEVIDWFLDEDDPEKKAIAVKEFELMREDLLNQNYFIAVDGSKNFYFIDSESSAAKFAPSGVLEEAEILDNWYFETKKMEKQYDLNIDLDRYLNILRVWINYKVMSGDEVVGAFGTGIEITGFIKEVLTQHAQNGTKTFVIDSSGMIQLDADTINIRDNNFQDSVSLDQGITRIVNSKEFERKINDFLSNPTTEAIFSIEGSSYNYAAISSIKDTGWYVITFFNSKSLFRVSSFLPIILIVLVLFLVYTVVIIQVMNRLFLYPFGQLNRSIIERGNQKGSKIYGLDRSDEFGTLANTIQDMKDKLDFWSSQLQKESDYKSGEIIRIFDTMPLGVFVLNDKFTIVYMNSYLLELFDLPQVDEVAGEYIKDYSIFFVDRKDYTEFMELLQTSQQIQVEYRLTSGIKEFWAELKVTRLIDDKGIIRYEGLLSNIQERKHYEENLLNRSITDALTGIFNRSRFDEVVQEEIERNHRYGENVTLMIFDLDFFKRVNDTYGHDVGDRVLVTVAETVKKEIRTTDIFARWGGEEFAILMPFTDGESGVRVAEKVRLSLEAVVHKDVGQVTASFGVSEYRTEETYVDWFKRVDAALFEAKHDGRNRVRLQSTDPVDRSLGMVKLAWKQVYESGNEDIDREHKQLLVLANELILTSLMIDQHDKETEAIQRIMIHIQEHFTHEIIILKENRYNKLEEHGKIHSALLEQMVKLEKMYLNHEIKASAFFSVIVDDIIVGHLINEDSKFFSLWKK